MQPNQQPNNSNPQPQNNGAWDFLYTQPEPPKQQKPSVFAQNKKFILIAGGAFALLLILLVVASFSSSGKTGNSDYITGPTTSVPLKDYDGQYLKMSYASSLNLNIDQQLDEPSGWFLDLAQSPEGSPYDISIQVDGEALDYVDGEQAVTDLFYGSDIQPFNLVTSDITIAGVPAKKTVGDYRTSNGDSMHVVYASAHVGDKYITVKATYPANNTDINDSFDAMVGSIVLK